MLYNSSNNTVFVYFLGGYGSLGNTNNSRSIELYELEKGAAGQHPPLIMGECSHCSHEVGTQSRGRKKFYRNSLIWDCNKHEFFSSQTSVKHQYVLATKYIEVV